MTEQVSVRASMMPGKFCSHKREGPLRTFPYCGCIFTTCQESGLPSWTLLGQCLVCIPELPSPSEWGWTRSESDVWQPLWSTLPEASKLCQELVKCGCKDERGCKGRCKCLTAGMSCTALCKCGGECTRKD